MSALTRAEHLQWCKDRALEYVDKGEFSNAMASMGSDLDKHPDTNGHVGMALGIQLMIGGMLRDEPEFRKFINGFN